VHSVPRVTETTATHPDVALLRRQDADAFSRLVAEQQRVVMGLAQSMGLRGADLDDAAAEAFVAVYKALPSFEERSSLSTWVYRIASRAIWQVREKRTKSNAPLDVNPSDDRQPTPASAVETEDQRQRIWETVAHLEPRQATAVELYYRFDTPIEEIAKILDCPTNTVKTLLHRARDVLRRQLAKEME
jgi:RNA polymerase sigma-70 factor (ECF subfamily)